jgi:hypothetical protein
MRLINKQLFKLLRPAATKIENVVFAIMFQKTQGVIDFRPKKRKVVKD